MKPLRFTTYRYLDIEFLVDAHKLFQQEEDQVKDYPGLFWQGFDEFACHFRHMLGCYLDGTMAHNAE